MPASIVVKLAASRRSQTDPCASKGVSGTCCSNCFIRSHRQALFLSEAQLDENLRCQFGISSSDLNAEKGYAA